MSYVQFVARITKVKLKGADLTSAPFVHTSFYIAHGTAPPVYKQRLNSYNSGSSPLLTRSNRLLQIAKQITNILRPYRQTNQLWIHARGQLLLFCQLLMCRAGRMDN